MNSRISELLERSAALVDILHRRITELEDSLETNKKSYAGLYREYTQLKAENELYRWLKENSDYVPTVVGNIEVTDEAIHAAMEVDK